MKLLGPDIVLVTTDGCGDGMLRCGTVDNVLATCDFGAGRWTPLKKNVSLIYLGVLFTKVVTSRRASRFCANTTLMVLS